VCWKPCSSCRSFHLLREEFLSAPIHSPLSGSLYRSFNLAILEQKRTETVLDATPATKKVCLGLADLAKTVVIGDNLEEK
jgi:hypothetical protein